MLLLMLFLGLLTLLATLVVGFRLLKQLVFVNAHLANVGLQLTDLQQTGTKLGLQLADLQLMGIMLDNRFESGLPEIERSILCVEEECARVRGHVAGVEVSVERIERTVCD